MNKKDLIKDEIEFTKKRIKTLNEKIEEEKDKGYIILISRDEQGHICPQHKTIEEVQEIIKELETRLEELKGE